MAEEKEGEPGLKSVNWDDEQDPDDPTLLRRIGVIPGGMYLGSTMRAPKIQKKIDASSNEH